MTRARCVVAAVALLFAGIQAETSLAQTLTGTVSSAAEGAMEGVLVSAQKAGSPITVTVVSDAQGRFRFPDGRLSPGHYTLRIRATGYDLAGPKTVELGPAPADIAINLTKTADLRRPAHQHRVAHEHARHGRTEAAADGVHELPHAAANRPFDIQCRTVRARTGAHGGLRQQYDPSPGADARRAGQNQYRRCRQACRLSGDDKSQQRAGLELRIENVAAAQRPRHPCRHHRIRFAAPDDRAA